MAEGVSFRPFCFYIYFMGKLCRFILSGGILLVGSHFPANAQVLLASGSPGALLVLTKPAPQAAAPTVSDTAAFPVAYCTALPRLEFGEWEKDYAKYERFLTPEIRRTQMGLSFRRGNVQTWWCQPSASPHAQLDTLTRLTQPRQLEGHWKSVLSRTIVHRDSAVISEQKFYRSAHLRPNNEQAEATLADGHLTLLGRHGATDALEKIGRKKYVVVSGRYLLVYGLSKGGGAVTQVGIDPAGRLLLHNCRVTERQVRGQYLTYETVLDQTIFERQP